MNEEEKKEQENGSSVEIELAKAIKALQDQQKEYDKRLQELEQKNVKMIKSIITGRPIEEEPTEPEEPEEDDPETYLLKTLRKKYKLEDDKK